MGDYLNSNTTLVKAGIRALELVGEDFDRLMKVLKLALRPKDINLFLQGIGEQGVPQIFGVLFPKVSYAERIRADEGASRQLMAKGLWSATVTLDGRNELGSEQRPSVKRDTINKGAFNACYSFNQETTPGGRIFVVDLRQKMQTRNPLVAGILLAWRQFQQRGQG